MGRPSLPFLLEYQQFWEGALKKGKLHAAKVHYILGKRAEEDLNNFQKASGKKIK